MTDRELMQQALEAWVGTDPSVGSVVWYKNMERFAALVTAAEREACAELVEGFDTCNPNHIAAAIRARGQA